MNTSKFVYRGAEYALDVDDLAVDARIDAAFDGLSDGIKVMNDGASPTSKAAQYVGLVKQFAVNVFADEGAGEALFGDATKLSEVSERLAQISMKIGDMRTLAFEHSAAVVRQATAAAAKKKKK